MADENGGGRIDRIEGAVASLTSSVATLTDVTGLIADQVNRLAEARMATQDTVGEAEAQQHTDEGLNALVATVDDLIRRTSPPPQ